MEDVIDAPNGTYRDVLSPDSLHALEQIYGYMTFNNNRYGILTNWRRALFLRWAEEAPDRHTLEFYTVVLDAGISMLKAWVGIVLLAETDGFYASPTLSSAPPNRNSNTSRKKQKRAFRQAEEYRSQLPVSRSRLSTLPI